MEHKNKFCIRPFNSIHIRTDGAMKVCCKIKRTQNYKLGKNTVDEFWKSKHRKDLTNLFLQSKQPDECEACWADESKGIKSLRQFSNDQYRVLGNKKPSEYLSILKKDTLDGPEDYNLDITNLCNLKCYMCSGDSSSRMLIENKDLDIEHLDQNDYNHNDETMNYLIEKIVTSNVTNITLQGGEPLINPKIIMLLKLLSESNQTKTGLKIAITTNGTMYSKEIFNILKKFKNVQLIFSIDGTEKVNDYLRFPSDFNKIKLNLDRYNKLTNASFMITCTVQNINILYIDNMIKFAKKNSMHLKLNMLYSPFYLHLTVLPISTRRKALRRLSKIGNEYLEHVTNYSSIKSILDSSMSEENIESIKIFKQIISKRDRYRKIKMSDFVPVLASDLGIK